jgi:hypothetical protein
MDKSGEDIHRIMAMDPSAYKKSCLYKKILLFVNLPLMVAIPTAINMNLLASLPAHKATAIFYLLHTVDAMLLFNSAIFYTLLSKLVKEIFYRQRDNKFVITQFSGWFMAER